MVTPISATQDESKRSGLYADESSNLWLSFAAVAALAVVLFTIRLVAPPNILDQDQERPASYVLDAVRNGNWICQRDLSGDIMSKPPLYTWLCALVTLGQERINEFALYLPGALAALYSAWLVLAFGRESFGPRAAFFASIACLLTTAGVKQLGLARTDGVFAFTVTLSALLAWRAWTLGRGWTWFWLAVAAATLTKGPLAVILGGAGLLAVLWERKSGDPLPMRGSNLPGILLFAGITVGWFYLAYWEMGQPLVDKMLSKELVGHALASKDKHISGTLIYQQPLYYLGRAAPWSLLAYFGLWRIWRQPCTDPGARRFERFLFCWFTVGLLVFSLAPHQRADLLWPIMPAAALIAGRELDRLTIGLNPYRFAVGFVSLVAVGVLGFAYYYFIEKKRDPFVTQTIAVKQLARSLESAVGREFPLTHVDDPMAFQFYLNTLRAPVSFERAAELLRGPEPAFVAVSDIDKLELGRNPGKDPPVHVLLETSAKMRKKSVAIVSNRPVLTPVDSAAFCFGSLHVRVVDARLIEATDREFSFRAVGEQGEVEVTNESSTPRRARVRIRTTQQQEIVREQLVPPTASMQVGWRAQASPSPAPGGG